MSAANSLGADRKLARLPAVDRYQGEEARPAVDRHLAVPSRLISAIESEAKFT